MSPEDEIGGDFDKESFIVDVGSLGLLLLV